MTDQPLFELEDLRVSFPSGDAQVRAVRGVSLRVEAGDSVGVVGESGSGKSVSFLAALGLLGPSAVIDGAVRLDGRDLVDLPAKQRRGLLGKQMAMVFQNPITALDPVMSVGAQIAEALRIHDPGLGRAEARAKAVDLLDRVGITDPERRAGQYPHEFSGGMCQRVMIAMAIANKPRLLVADEPTTAVDVTIQAQLLKLLHEVANDLQGAFVLITHDLGVVAENTRRIVVMYGGRVMEAGLTSEVLADPRHPYTQGLLSCHPSLESDAALVPIPGSPPDPATLGEGCPFAARCPIGKDKDLCHQVTPPLEDHDGRLTACHFAGQVAFAQTHDSHAGPEHTADEATGEPLLSGRSVKVEFGRKGLRLSRRSKPLVAVDAVDVELRPGETLGVVGESGSGKSTLAHAMVRLTDTTSGEILFDGQDITKVGRRGLNGLRDNVQVVFQDPYTALNPSLSVAANAAEPLRVRGVPARERRERVAALFEEVGLNKNMLDRLPGELSGGQLQRVGIARALSVDPQVLVLDEPVSALDVSVQAQILNLLKRLQQARGLSYLFISHDMAVVRYISHRVAVMYLGRIVETGPAEQVLAHPVHPYTEGMIAAVPELGRPDSSDQHKQLATEQSRGALTHSGCRFEPRCRLRVADCTDIDPLLVPTDPAHQVACLVRAPSSQENHRESPIQ
ncbi:dipeptide ABC transporter ATP-binding protein [Propionibacteriaceae bacterium Y1923]